MIGVIKEAYRRNPVLFYLGIALTIMFILFVVTFRDCQHSMSEICHWLKPCKFSASFALYAFTLGWFLEYLKDTLGKPKIKVISWLLAVVITIEMIIIFFQGWLKSEYYVHLLFPMNTSQMYSRELYVLANTFIVTDALIVAYITVQFFRKISLQPEAYLWAIRAGFVTLLFSCGLGAFLVDHYGQVPLDLNHFGFPFTSFDSLRDIILSMHFLGIHYLQILPFCCYYFQKYCGKIFVVASVVIYAIVSLIFVLKSVT